MGRIRTKWVKNMAKELINRYPDRFDANFQNNKEMLNQLNIISDKSVRNKVAGYIVNLKKRES
ncbi:MAG: 30S ribosomal protein S17e [Candidatus Aenigmatarchaeota archaeon]